jgi:hypothetical protein
MAKNIFVMFALEQFHSIVVINIVNHIIFAAVFLCAQLTTKLSACILQSLTETSLVMIRYRKNMCSVIPTRVDQEISQCFTLTLTISLKMSAIVH